MSSPVGPVEEQYRTPARSGPAPVNLAEYERYAQDTLPRNANDYYASGANDMITLRENRAAFARLRIIPRVFVDVSRVDTKTTVLGCEISSPICVAPTAMQKMAHSDGECATARAAARHNTLMGLSSLSTTALEDVAAAAPNGPRWFQLYVYKDRSVTLDLVRRAERAGYKAIAVTVDTPLLGRREADIRNRFTLPSHLTMGNFEGRYGGDGKGGDKGDMFSQGTKTTGNSGSGLTHYISSLIDPSLTWDAVAFLRAHTRLPIVVKGVLSADDAVLAVQHGCDGVWVSNHGARQLDTSPATIEVLGDIVRAVQRETRAQTRSRPVEVYLDGGILRGTDVFKALALGARAVFLGRPVLWGLAHSGEDGVFHVLQLINEELKLAMQLSGVTSIQEIKPSFIRTAASLRSKL